MSIIYTRRTSQGLGNFESTFAPNFVSRFLVPLFQIKPKINLHIWCVSKILNCCGALVTRSSYSQNVVFGVAGGA